MNRTLSIKFINIQTPAMQICSMVVIPIQTIWTIVHMVKMTL